MAVTKVKSKSRKFAKNGKKKTMKKNINKKTMRGGMKFGMPRFLRSPPPEVKAAKAAKAAKLRHQQEVVKEHQSTYGTEPGNKYTRNPNPMNLSSNQLQFLTNYFRKKGLK